MKVSFPGLRSAAEKQKSKPFCLFCGSVVDGTSETCAECGRPVRLDGAGAHRFRRELEESETLKELRRDVGDEAADDLDQVATIQEECPKCKHIGLTFRTAQLRSADEGQTIFYTCPKCKYKFSINS